VLFAYQYGNDVRIADVDFLRGTSLSNTTQGEFIAASDIVDITVGWHRQQPA